MHSSIITFGSFALTPHGVMAALGVLAGIGFSYWLAPQYRKKMVDNLVIVTIVGLIGARLTYAIIYHSQFYSIGSVFYPWGGGFVSYGGMVFGGSALAIILIKQKQNIAKWFDSIAPGFFFGLGLGRTGEILSGEFSGVATSSSIAQGFMNTGVFNAPLFEAILSLLLFALGVYLKKNRVKTGNICLLTVMIYTFVRFIIDFGRIEHKIGLNISIGQAASIVLFLFSVILLLLNQNGCRERSKNATI